LGLEDLEVTDVAELGARSGSSIVTELTSRGERRKLLGLYPLRVTYSAESTGNGRPRSLDLVAKVKPLDAEIIVETGKLASLCGREVAEAWSRWGALAGFSGAHTRELAIYRRREPGLAAILPKAYGVYEDADREAFVILMERLGNDLVAFDAADDPRAWTAERIEAAVNGIAGVHATWLGREAELLAEGWLGPVTGSAEMARMADLWLVLAEHNAAEHPKLLDADATARIRRWATSAGEWWRELEALPRTLVHNDFNPRNIALRPGGRQLVAYDWELATLGVPQRDIAELLAFVLGPGADPGEVGHYLELHRLALEQAAGARLDREAWRRGYELALRDLVVTRLQLYLMTHTHREYPFLERVVATAMRLLEIESERLEPAGAKR
ncbi:MAG: phosphotransferase, partial [Solirubrobacterales bacterium]